MTTTEGSGTDIEFDIRSTTDDGIDLSSSLQRQGSRYTIEYDIDRIRDLEDLDLNDDTHNVPKDNPERGESTSSFDVFVGTSTTQNHQDRRLGIQPIEFCLNDNDNDEDESCGFVTVEHALEVEQGLEDFDNYLNHLPAPYLYRKRDKERQLQVI